MNHPLTRREALAVGLGVLLEGTVTAVEVPNEDRKKDNGKDSGKNEKPDRSAKAPGRPNDALVRYVEPRTYEVQHRVDVQPGGVRIDTLELWLPIPPDDDRQTVSRLQIHPRVPTVRDATGLVQIAVLVQPDRPNGRVALRSLALSYRVTCRRVVADLDALGRLPAAAYRKDRTYRLFTRPETKLDMDDPRIRRVAAQCQGTNRSPLEIARAAYEWVMEHTEYKLIEGFGGAAYCLEKGHGECGDYAALFTAICRVAGLPVRPASGFWADKTDGWHCWAEIMLPSGHWLPVDCQIGDQNPFSRAVSFGQTDNRRVALCKTYDVEVTSGRVKRKNNFLQTGSWWWTGQLPTEKKPQPEATFRLVGQPVADQSNGRAA